MKAQQVPRITVWFLHLDMGIGGAERLIVTMASTLLQFHSMNVKIFTTHHNPNHCFEETSATKDGILSSHLYVYGDWIPRQLPYVRRTGIYFGLTALCGTIRMFYLSFVVLIALVWSRLRNCEIPNILFIDGISSPLILLRLAKFINPKIKLVYYCHFPDKLLCLERPLKLNLQTFPRLMYRILMDNLEEISTSLADEILVNSEFTSQIFRKSFTAVLNSITVVYPCIDNSLVQCMNSIMQVKDSTQLQYCSSFDDVFVSINRFERKKNLKRAIDSFLTLRELLGRSSRKLLLIIAGGYDPQNLENMQHLKELMDYCLYFLPTNAVTLNSCGSIIASSVVDVDSAYFHIEFRTSISSEEKNRLLLYPRTHALVYTPSYEHFGIVPIEAMALRCPVICCNSGGPVETIINGITGFLVDCEDENESDSSFADVMLKFVVNPSLKSTLGNDGYLRVHEKFSPQVLADHLCRIFFNLLSKS